MIWKSLQWVQQSLRRGLGTPWRAARSSRTGPLRSCILYGFQLFLLFGSKCAKISLGRYKKLCPPLRGFEQVHHCTTTASTMAPSKHSGSAKAKPYDRPAKNKGKAKAAPADLPTTLSSSMNIGAPSSKQPSRKGKKAWRKNVDITAEEVALEQAREEERVTGSVSPFRRPCCS